MAKKKAFNEKDIILLSGGRLLQIYEIRSDTGMVHVQFIDRSETSFFGIEHLQQGKNLGQADHMILTFEATHGVHKRLNRLAAV